MKGLNVSIKCNIKIKKKLKIICLFSLFQYKTLNIFWEYNFYFRKVSQNCTWKFIPNQTDISTLSTATVKINKKNLNRYNQVPNFFRFKASGSELNISSCGLSTAISQFSGNTSRWNKNWNIKKTVFTSSHKKHPLLYSVHITMQKSPFIILYKCS